MGKTRSTQNHTVVIDNEDLPERIRLRVPVEGYKDIAEVDIIIAFPEQWAQHKEALSSYWKTQEVLGLMLAAQVKFDPDPATTDPL